MQVAEMYHWSRKRLSKLRKQKSERSYVKKHYVCGYDSGCDETVTYTSDDYPMAGLLYRLNEMAYKTATETGDAIVEMIYHDLRNE